MRDNNQKIKLLRLYDILKMESDEDTPMTTAQLCDRLIAENISCDRRTLARDIVLLNECGYEVLSCRVGHSQAFYVSDRPLDLYEIQFLVDASQAATCITEERTEELIDKLTNIAGENYAKRLKASHTKFAVKKHTNKSILINIDHLREAISARSKASFYYFDLNECHERVYHKEKKLYTVEPIALVYNEDNYYMIAYDPSTDTKTRTYRIDRMESVAIVEEHICTEAEKVRKSYVHSKATVFKMFHGCVYQTVLEFEPGVLGAVYDKFGEDIRVRKVDSGALRVTLDITISDPFYGWVFQFGPKMRILSPEPVRKGFLDHARNTIARYETD